jgi:HEPN domain-containing protein
MSNPEEDMASTGYANERDKCERYINGYATQSFRDQADRDYIAARTACRSQLFPQFLWSAQQAIEKYLKAILLYNRIAATDVKHDIQRALALTSQLPFQIRLSQSSKEFIEHVGQVGQYRYLEVPYDVHGFALPTLDKAVWEIRRYCQPLDIFWRKLQPEEQARHDARLEAVRTSDDHPPHKFRIEDGLLEEILAAPKHPARIPLIWQNGAYSNRARRRVKAQWHFHAQNPLLYLYPEMLDDLQQLIYVPKPLAESYRQHLQAIKKDPKKRP